MSAAKTARCFAETFEGSTAAAVKHDGEWYIVTDETGDGCFAYAVDACADALNATNEAIEAERDAQAAAVAADIERDSDFAPYALFCDHAEPEEDEALAAAVWLAIGKRICHAGSCDPVDIAV